MSARIDRLATTANTPDHIRLWWPCLSRSRQITVALVLHRISALPSTRIFDDSKIYTTDLPIDLTLGGAVDAGGAGHVICCSGRYAWSGSGVGYTHTNTKNKIQNEFITRRLVQARNRNQRRERRLLLDVISIWVGQVKRVESVQRTFTKRLPGYSVNGHRCSAPNHLLHLSPSNWVNRVCFA